MLALEGVAVSYGRGTPVLPLVLLHFFKVQGSGLASTMVEALPVVMAAALMSSKPEALMSCKPDVLQTG